MVAENCCEEYKMAVSKMKELFSAGTINDLHIAFDKYVTIEENESQKEVEENLLKEINMMDVEVKGICCAYRFIRVYMEHEWTCENLEKTNESEEGPPEHYGMKERAEMHQEMRSEFKAINARMDKQDQQFNTIQNSVQKLPEQMQKGLEDFVERRSCGGVLLFVHFRQFDLVFFAHPVFPTKCNFASCKFDVLCSSKPKFQNVQSSFNNEILRVGRVGTAPGRGGLRTPYCTL